MLAEWRGAAAAHIIAASAGLARTASAGLSRNHADTACSADAFGAPTRSPAAEQPHHPPGVVSGVGAQL